MMREPTNPFLTPATRLAGLFCLALRVGLPLNCVGAEESPPDHRRNPKLKIEVKLVVPADRVQSAVQTLGLDGKPSAKVEVVFFDTPEGDLFAQGLILRTRWRPDGSGDSTAKLRTSTGALKLSEVEEQIKPEEDWTDEARPAISRSVNNTALSHGLIEQVIHGGAGAKQLFNSQQRELLEAHLKNLPWDRLRRYGPCEAEVWKENIFLRGFADAVTVERWHLQKQERKLEILEISVKAKTQNETAARAWVKAFYKAAADTNLGRPPSQSKTRIVMDFFKPGD